MNDESVNSRLTTYGEWRGLEEASIIENLSAAQALGKEYAEMLWDEEGVAKFCPATYGRGSLAGLRCKSPAGKGTSHVGFGSCVAHGGAKRVGRAEGGWLMALSFVGERDITPWQAMLEQVRLLAGQVAYCQQKIAEVEAMDADGGGECLLVGGAAHPWVVLLEARGDRLARVSKAAIDAGIAERLVRQVELEAELMVRALSRALELLPALTDEDRETVMTSMSEELVRLEREQNTNFGRVPPAMPPAIGK